MALVRLECIQIYKVIGDFIDENRTLQDSLNNDPDSSVNDWVNMIRMWERLYYLRSKIQLHIDLQALIIDVENEKDRFWVQKNAQKYFEDLRDELNALIKVGRTWKYKDYRCIDWIKRLTEAMVQIKDFFENERVVIDKSDAKKMN